MLSRPFRILIAACSMLTLVAPAALAQRSGGTVATDRIFDAIGLREGMTICEMGAGDGELSIAAARRVGRGGRVLTSELGEERVKALQEKAAGSGLEHITVVAGDPSHTNFAVGACDGLFMRNVYHHLADPAAMDGSIAASLKPGGRVAVVDFRPPGQEAAAPADRDNDGTHGVGPESVAQELEAAGLVPASTERGEQRWFMVVASKPSH